MRTYEEIVEFWKSNPIEKESDLDKQLSSFRVLFAYHSGKIENQEITYSHTREIFENGRVTNFTGDPRALFEQQNQRLCYEYLKPYIIRCRPIDRKLICEVHKALVSGCYDDRRYLQNKERPGEFKKNDYVTGVHEVGAHPLEVEGELLELVDEITSFEGKNVLMAAAYFHAKFEYIHPFADGNGRAGRTLMNYFLMTHGHPPVVVHEEDRRKYYEGLSVYDEEERLDTLHDFLQKQLEKTWNRETTERKKTLLNFTE